MKTNLYHWKTSDGLEIFAKSWQPDSGNIKGAITLVHGMGEHIERYDHVAEILTAEGYAMLGYDHRGHGKSEGNRGHIPSYEQFLDDVAQTVSQTKDLFPDVPQFIYGHSMGGCLVANYLIKRQPDLKAAVLSAPYFRLTTPAPSLKVSFGRLTQNLVPKLTLPTGLNADHISRDKEEVRKYVNDPLVHDKISAKMGISVVDAGEYAIAHSGKIKVPTLVLHGSGDKITDSKASVAFAKNAGPEVHIKLHDGLYHEIHNEPEKPAVFKDIIDWLNSHV